MDAEMFLHYQTAKIGSLVDIQDSEDPEGLRVFYYLVQDLKVRVRVRVPRSGRMGGSSMHVCLCLWCAVLDLLPHLSPLQDQAYISVRAPALPQGVATPQTYAFFVKV